MRLVLLPKVTHRKSARTTVLPSAAKRTTVALVTLLAHAFVPVPAFGGLRKPAEPTETIGLCLNGGYCRRDIQTS